MSDKMLEREMGLGSLVSLAATPTYARGSNLQSTLKFPFHCSGGSVCQPGGVQRNLPRTNATMLTEFAVYNFYIV
jgi:hypothetical protein